MSLQITKEEYFAVLDDLRKASLEQAGKDFTDSDDVIEDIKKRLKNISHLFTDLSGNTCLLFVYQMGLEAGIKIQQRRDELYMLEYLKK